ncbi:hypothetical protein GCM10007079_22930 [Nocardiopsis terrae]|nr:hypothetical protein GCM10007079_22930 [Nocardiopsis terrae]
MPVEEFGACRAGQEVDVASGTDEFRSEVAADRTRTHDKDPHVTPGSTAPVEQAERMTTGCPAARAARRPVDDGAPRPTRSGASRGDHLLPDVFME